MNSPFYKRAKLLGKQSMKSLTLEDTHKIKIMFLIQKSLRIAINVKMEKYEKFFKKN